jgi:predicted nucleic acid-binding protein
MAMNLTLRIPDNATVLFDTNPIIYVLEGHPLATRFEPIFADVETGRIQALVTPITLA